MGSIPESFTADYYNEDYFVTSNGKKFKRADGTTGAWSYANPQGEWHGCRPIVEAWKSIFHPKNALDVGCGRGTFIAYMRDVGIRARGFDFSEWSVNNRYSRCNKKWIKNCDVTKPWPYPDKSFDLVTVLDLMEHIYSDNISDVISEMYRVSKKWIFLEIATVGKGSGSDIHEKGYILKKEEQVPIELQCYAVAGHVTVSTEEFWIQKLKRDGWIVRRNLVEKFCRIVPKDVLANWILNTMLILEKVE